ncbi:MAG: ATP-dependent Clp protease proteolytic subunit [Acetatifactor sp.]|nr:ATP-dependent Clp protease proteolytic subunit [Acetatifactor sp.]
MEQYLLTMSSHGYNSFSAPTLLSLERTLWMNGPIDEQQSFQLISALLYLDSLDCTEITLLIHSAGGSVQEGLTIYDTIRTLKSPVKTVAVGYVASMASVILSAGTPGRRFAMPSSTIMIHEPLVSEISYTNVSQIIELGESLKQTKEQINSILAQTTKKDIQIINNDTRQNKYFTAEEAIQYGLIDGLWDNS